MITSKEQKEELEEIVDPVIKWLNDNCHPHTHLVIDSTRAELSEGVCAIQNEKHIKD